LFALPFVLSAQTAKIKIDVDRTIGEVDPNIYGVFMEPIHFNGRRMGLPDTVDFNTLYGTLYDPSSPLADRNGYGKAEASVVTSDSLYAAFMFDKQKEYTPATNALEASGNMILYTFPAHSFTQIKAGVK
jgi:alpha-L-arabinofuranosidase